MTHAVKVTGWNRKIRLNAMTKDEALIILADLDKQERIATGPEWKKAAAKARKRLLAVCEKERLYEKKKACS